MNVDVFGGCGNETSKNACPYNSKCENFIIENYKFFLAFENSLCDDYITEKAYQWFSKDIVLVVRGARKYHRYLPQGTYVDAEDFDHPWKLAVYLEQLAQNEEEYVRILKLKDQFKVVSHVEMMNAGFCELCRRLNDIESYRKSYKDIGAWEVVRREWKHLAGTGCQMYEQFPPEVLDKQRRLVPMMKDARKEGKRAWIAYDTLCVIGKQ
ncbi:alpha-(1,3)-fucosyltransferase C-like [Mya arenaria]|uniref:alpha-(1,3)-fucosyltransferase C-like n=1 Tax=Mya arenaria TaxID=6604 RepID=UPI0022E5AF7C|nr:alpha-(1,3)-fucosyltransferase C-like [Mya arenaria]